jgi:hypothetical protein
MQRASKRQKTKEKQRSALFWGAIREIPLLTEFHKAAGDKIN